MDINADKTVYIRPASKPPKLFAIWGGKAHEFKLSGRQSFGRSSEHSAPELSVPLRTVSRDHGEFTVTASGCTYRDNGSTNGTLHNGVLLAPGEPVALADGDVLRIHGRDDGSMLLDVVLIFSTDYLTDTCWKTQQLGDIAEIAVGRTDMPDLTDRSVSRKHASFFRATGGWAILDHGSLNGVFVNSRRVGQPKYLSPMDVVRVGKYFFLYTGDSLVYQCQRESVRGSGKAVSRSSDVLSIEIRERNVWERAKKKTLLKDIRLRIPVGSMVLILGGSGAGKTTFMNAVMGYEPAEGRILYKDTDIYDEYEKMKYEIGYVPQQDLLRMKDTVYDTLMNAAHMRLPARKPADTYISAVDNTMELLGLERERDSLVEKLSGGQRKRLSIAVEYIGNPSLFFLDEPDSGLDGVMARALMENLRAIADSGKIVMVISHSPDRAFELFDSVIILAKSSRDGVGHLVFYGPPKKACSFFETDSLEGVVKRINRPDEGGDGRADEFIEKYSRSERA